MARCKATVVIRSCDAAFISKAISVDNLPYVRTHSEGDCIITEVEVNSVGSMLVTLDDILVNVKVANDVLCGLNSDEDIRD